MQPKDVASHSRGLLAKLNRASSNGRKTGAEKKIIARLNALATMLDMQAIQYMKDNSVDRKNPDLSLYVVGFRTRVGELPHGIQNLILEFEDSLRIKKMDAWTPVKINYMIDMAKDFIVDRILLE